jgi:hypothetical protein
MKAKFHLFKIIPLFVFLAQCDHIVNSGPEPIPELKCEPSASGELMPLEAGNYWVYQIWPFITPDTVITEVTRKVPVKINGETYEASAVSPPYPIHGARPVVEWLYWNGPCGLYWLGGIAESDTFLYKTLLFKYPAEVGESWTTVRINYEPYFRGFYFFDTLTVSLVSKEETITTPAGEFKCYLYSYRKRPDDDVYLMWDYYHYFIPDLGRVAYITKDADEEAMVKDRMYLIRFGSNPRGTQTLAHRR